MIAENRLCAAKSANAGYRFCAAKSANAGNRFCAAKSVNAGNRFCVVKSVNAGSAAYFLSSKRARTVLPPLNPACRHPASVTRQKNTFPHTLTPPCYRQKKAAVPASMAQYSGL